MMKKMNKKIIIIGLLLTFIIPLKGIADERSDGYYTVVDESNNKKIFVTAREINIGDKYLNEDNFLYKIVRIDGDIGYARFERKVDLNKAFEASNLNKIEKTLNVFKAKNEKLIAIYHTHSDESYIPTDGKSSIPHKGGIYKVGTSLKRYFSDKNVNCIQSYNSHDPHDAMAYKRSRQTAIELLKRGPDALLDLHRDAVPAEEYQGNISGKPIAKVRLVVGRQNPQKKAVNNFAWQIKAVADKKYPGFIKGIFYGKGNYNQDIFPRSILVEAGTYTNKREEAEAGMSFLSDVICTTLYGENYRAPVPVKKTPIGKIQGKTQVPGENRRSYSGAMWLIAIFVVGLGAFIVISTGGIKELTAKTKKFIGSEFTNFLGKIRRNKTKEDKEKNNKK